VAEFSAGDTALTGFRIAWQHPKAVAVWAVLQMAVSLALTVFVTLSAGPAFERMTTVGFQPNPDPAVLMGLMRQLAPTYAVLLIGSLVYYAVLYAAMNRAVLRPQADRFGYLRLASDELRQLGLFAIMALLGFGLYIALIILAVVVLSLLALVGVGGIGAAGGLELLLVVPAVVAVFIYVGVRFSLASPATFAAGRINLMASWTLTRGRFWRLFVTYAMAFGLSLVVLALTLVIAVLLAGVAGGGLPAAGASMQTDFSSLSAVLTPSRLVYLAVSAIGTALGWPITMAPPAVIYRALIAGQNLNGVGRVFE
jgi:hypothetical protein